jgi:hypothetical protein
MENTEPIEPVQAAELPAEWPAEWVLPQYAGYSIANLGASVLEHFGAEPPEVRLAEDALPRALLDGARTVILLVLDALGYDQLMERLAEGTAPRLAERLDAGGARLAQLTSIFPSTTAAAMTTLHTAVAPARHGMPGFTLYLPAVGEVVNMLTLRPANGQAQPSVEPEDFLPVPTIHRRLAGAGVASHCVTGSTLLGTSLSRMLTDGATTHGYVSSADLCVWVRRLAEERAGLRFILAYWPAVDTIAHWYGPGSDEHRAEVAALDFILDRELLGRLPEDTLLLITADHGHMATNREHTVLLHEHPALLELLAAPPAGERRAIYLYVAPEHVAAARAYIAATFGEVVTVLTRGEALAAGLFGLSPVWAPGVERIGDLVLLARGDWQLPYLHNPEYRQQPWEHLTIGAHGGLTSAEVRVPLIAMRG